ncbi:MAG: CDP-alcohol phosphatidyltransferase family protein [Chloroflexi bacterium]|nr:CDP-alcohol phosphatidyltransferase family protein [Chloroflexota bacterium]
MHEAPRRPIKARKTAWAGALARLLLRLGVRPNQVSVASVLFAALAAGCILFSRQAGPVGGVLLLVTAAVCIQLRLLSNMLDGMLAMEGGLKTSTGELFNDVPDRISDTLVLLAAGYAATWTHWGSELGWAAALLAMATAYVRVLGGSAGAHQHFNGPMAKQQRMMVVTAACIAATFEIVLGWPAYAFTTSLALVIAGCVPTIIFRLAKTSGDLTDFAGRSGTGLVGK